MHKVINQAITASDFLGEKIDKKRTLLGWLSGHYIVVGPLLGGAWVG
jgi:hypothetical protein